MKRHYFLLSSINYDFESKFLALCSSGVCRLFYGEDLDAVFSDYDEVIFDAFSGCEELFDCFGYLLWGFGFGS